MTRDRAYLEHILEAVRRIEENATDGQKSFLDSHTVQDAILRNLQTLAESTQRLSDEIKATRPEVEWRRISAFRNILVHDYLGIDLELVWRIVEEDVPDLKEVAEALLDAV